MMQSFASAAKLRSGGPILPARAHEAHTSGGACRRRCLVPRWFRRADHPAPGLQPGSTARHFHHWPHGLCTWRPRRIRVVAHRGAVRRSEPRPQERCFPRGARIVRRSRLSYAIIQTITFSLYLYSAELYPTRLRTLGTGLGSAWLRLGSSSGPILVGWIIAGFGIQYVFGMFACVVLVGAVVMALFAIETKGRVLEKLSP